jgi:hypothetical protein
MLDKTTIRSGTIRCIKIKSLINGTTILTPKGFQLIIDQDNNPNPYENKVVMSSGEEYLQSELRGLAVEYRMDKPSVFMADKAPTSSIYELIRHDKDAKGNDIVLFNKLKRLPVNPKQLQYAFTKINKPVDFMIERTIKPANTVNPDYIGHPDSLSYLLVATVYEQESYINKPEVERAFKEGVRAAIPEFYKDMENSGMLDILWKKYCLNNK